MGKCEMYPEKNFKACKREWKVIYKATKMEEMMNFMEKLIGEPMKIENVWSFNRRECWLGNAFLSKKYDYMPNWTALRLGWGGERERKAVDGRETGQRGRDGREGGKAE
jgi:hypothetical protein